LGVQLSSFFLSLIGMAHTGVALKARKKVASF
jgi:hypothetical protein